MDSAKEKKGLGHDVVWQLLRDIYPVYLWPNDCDVHPFISRASRWHQFSNAWGKSVLVGKAY